MRNWISVLHPQSTRWWCWALVIAAHAMGVLVLAGLSAAAYFDSPLVQLFLTAWHEGTFVGELAQGLGVHLLLAGVLWAMICLLLARWGRAGSRGDSQPVPRLVLKRGTVFVETLLVVPVALLLIFGLAQMAVVNMAGVLANLATFEAARAVWLWDGERERFEMTDENVAGMARVQAAAVLTPVVPATFVNATQDLASDTEAAKRMRGLLVGSQLPYATWNMDVQGREMADRIMSHNQPVSSSFASAFDTQSFIERSARKFSLAYQSVEVVVAREDDEIGVTLIYRHQCVFPLVAGLFGQRTTVAEIDGYFTTIRRQFGYPRQLEANAYWPKSSDWVHGEPVHTSDFF